MSDIVTSPIKIVVDTREQVPYTFQGLKADAVDGGGPLIIPTVRGTLASGDYSILDYTHMVTVERKTLTDLASTLTAGRRRFLAEMERLREYDAAWIVIEGQMSDMMGGHLLRSMVKPRTLWRTAMYWQIRYPRVHWWAVPGRAIAEAMTYQLLKAWWVERIDKPAAKARRARKK